MEPFVWREAAEEGQPSLFMLEPWMDKYPELTAGFTSRLGGVSEAPYGSLNCGLHVQDDAISVVENRRRLAQAIATTFDASTYAEQVHGTSVITVGHAERGAGREDRRTALPDTDGLITGVPGVTLNLMFADCVPLYFYDPQRRAIGLAHAGWKGSVGKIAMVTVTKMAQTFGSRPEDLLAAIGPSIDSCCYEVDDYVADRVKAVLDEISASTEQRKQVLQAAEVPGKYRLGLKNLNRLLMTKAGILSSHIEVSSLCTGCDTGRFFSHRKEGGKTGRMIAWIALRA